VDRAPQRHAGAPYGGRRPDLAAAAGRAALAEGGVDAGALDLVIVATTSPDEVSPHAATFVAGALDARRAGAIDVSAACVGFLSALALAVSTIEASRADSVLLVGATRSAASRTPTTASRRCSSATGRAPRW
jgi:3-oxoacyl-[acyl-carrier-protein] synthase III